ARCAYLYPPPHASASHVPRYGRSRSTLRRDRAPRRRLQHADRAEPTRRPVAVDGLDPVAVLEAAPGRPVEVAVRPPGDRPLGGDQRMAEALPGVAARAVDLEAEQIDLGARAPA